jgi:hypothetical protein
MGDGPPALTNELCRELIGQLSGFIAGSMDCMPVSQGYEAIVTPFLYPDRDNIEIFVQELGDGRVLMTDLGQTMMKLSEYGFVPTPQSPRRRAMIFQVISSMNVTYERGSIVAVANRLESAPRMWDVAMAIQRLSDLVFTVPGYTKATFSDEFEGFAVDTGIPYARGVPIRLPTTTFMADFVFADRNVVQLISAGSPGYARERVNSVYTNFSEMRLADDTRRRFAVIDDRVPTVDAGMRQMLSHQADRVVSWSRKGELERLLQSVA